jgi:hypothetical protein
MSYFIDTDQGLYVIDSGTGYSCLGFAVAERKRQAVLVWADGVADGPYALGTPEHYEAYTQAMAIGLAHHLQTKERCPAELTPQLVGLEGKRVEVTEPGEKPRRFIVGKSTGWMPCHIERKRRDSSGGYAAMVGKDATVRVIA